MFWVFLGSGFLHLCLLLRLKCLPTKRIKTNRDLVSVVTFVSHLTYIDIALPIGNQARVMTPVSLLRRPVISVHLSQMNKWINFNTGNAIYRNTKRGTLLVQKMMNLIFWVRAMGILLLVLMQTLRVLQTTYLPHPHIPNPYPSVHCLSKRQPKLSHPPQVLPYSRKLKQI